MCCVQGVRNAWYSSYVQKCLLVARVELGRYFGWMRGNASVEVRVRMVVMGAGEVCVLEVGREGVEIVRDEGGCREEVREWFGKLFGLAVVS